MRTFLNKQILFAFILISFFAGAYAPSSHFSRVPYTEAQTDCAGPCASEATSLQQLVKETVGTAASVASEGLDRQLVLKEFGYDGIASEIRGLILRQITSSIVQWINTGFQGSPAFVTDLEGFLIDTADQVAGRFIQRSELFGFICDPFELDVRIALELQYQATIEDEVQCTFTESIGNIQNFVNGTFAEGGWVGWFELTQRPQNTPVGSAIVLSLERDAQIRTAQKNAEKELDWGNGTFPKKVCEFVEGEITEDGACKVTMPGAYIQEQLNSALSLGTDELVVADEINEILGALFAQLAQQAIAGANGLLGLASQGISDAINGSGGNQSYLDAMVNERVPTSNNSLSIFNNAIGLENEYRRLFAGVSETVDSLREENSTSTARYAGCYNVRIPSRITSYQTTADREVAAAENNIALLNLMVAELQSPNITPEQKQQIYTTFQNLQADRSLHGEIDIAEAELDLRDFDPDVREFEQTMAAEVSRCRELEGDAIAEEIGGSGR